MKRTMTRQTLSLLVAICMVVALLPAGMFRASAVAGGGDMSFDLLADFTEYANGAGIVAVDGNNVSSAPRIKNYALGSTYGWNAGNILRNEVNDWLWTQSALLYGLFFKSDFLAESYNSIAINVTAGTYKMDLSFLGWDGGGTLTAYLVPSTTMIPTIDQIKNGGYTAKSTPIYTYRENNKGVAITETVIPYVELSAGTYYVVFHQTAPCPDTTYPMPGYFIRNIDFTPTTAISGVTISGTPSEPLLTGASAQLSATVLPAGVTQNVTWVSSNPHIVSVDANGKVTATGIGTATITAKSASPSKSASVTIITRPDTTKYEYRESVDEIWGNATGGLNTANSKYIDTIGATLFTNANWKPGALVSDPTLGRWLWTPSARSIGIYFEAKAENAYNSVDIYVPKAGWYKAVSHDNLWTGGGTVEVYLAPQTSDYNTLMQTKLFKSNPINHYGTEEKENLLAEYVYLNAGNYTVLYQQTQVGVNANPGYFIHGLHLERYPDVTGVGFAWETLELSQGETRELISEVYPVGVLQDVTYTSKNPEIAEVVDGEIIAKKPGVTTITATSVADTTKSKSIKVTVGAKSVYYDYRTKNGAATLAVDGWEINHDACSDGSGFEWVDTSGLSVTYGLFFGNVFGHPSTNTTDYVSVNVRVPVDGIYQISSVYPIWQHGGIMDVYIVETWQADQFLTKGTKLNLDAMDHRFDVNDKSRVKTVETLHEIEVALEADRDYTLVYRIKDLNQRQGFYLLGTRLTEMNISFDFYRSTPIGVTNEGAPALADHLWSAQRGVMANHALWRWTPSSAYNELTGGAGLYMGNAYGSPNEQVDSLVPGDYSGINLKIPAAGWYEVSVNWLQIAGGGSFNVYLMKTSDTSKLPFKDYAQLLTHEPICVDGQYTYCGVNQKLDEKYYFEAPGEYTLVFELTDVGGGIYIRAAEFTPVLYVDEILIDEEETVILEDEAESYDIAATVRSEVARNPAINWTSSDESVATVDEGHITFLENGHAAITAEAADGSGLKKVIHFLRGYEISYNYNFRESLKPIYDAHSSSLAQKVVYIPATDPIYAAEANAFMQGYEASIAAGSAPWMYAGGTETISYSNSTTGGYGIFVDYGSPNDYAQMKLRVDGNGKYHMVFNHDRWKVTSGAFDLFLAPVNATDPCAERWKIHSYTPKYVNEELRNEVYLGTRPIPEGEYYFTLKFKEPSDNKLIGFSSFKLIKYAELGKYTIEGGQIRLAGTNAFGKSEPQGLRFVSWIDKNIFNVDSADVQEFGTVLVPTEALTSIDELIIGGKPNGFEVAKVPAVNRYVDHKDYVCFTAVVTDLPERQYDMSITARVYVILKDGTTIYGGTYTERSIYEVAINGLEKHYDELSAEEIAEFNRIKGAVEK